MVFSSITFLTGFLPIVLLLYFLLPSKGRNSHRLRNTLLFVVSLIFYAWGEPVYVILMIISTFADYGFALYADRWNRRGNRRKARRAVYATVAFNLGMLGFFKYTDFLISTVNGVFDLQIPLLNLPLPIGISFYSFQTMSYTIDVYRGEAKPQHNPLDLGAYVALFPQLIAGPIVRYSTIAEQLQSRKESLDRFSDGFCRFIIGLGKKVLIANQVGYIFTQLSTPVLTGLYLSGHPMDDYKGYLKSAKLDSIADIQNGKYPDGKRVNIGGIISGLKVRQLKNNNLLCSFKIEDFDSAVSVTVFGNAYEMYKPVLTAGKPIIMSGRISEHEDRELEIVFEKCQIIPDEAKNVTVPKYKSGLYLKIPNTTHPSFTKVKDILSRYNGDYPVYIICTETNKKLEAPKNLYINHSAELMNELVGVLGEKNIKYIN